MTALTRAKAEELASTVSPHDLLGYLRSRGWSKVPSRRPEAAVFRHEAEPWAEVYIPLDRAFADYAEAIATAASRIGEQEGRARESVLRDLQHVRRDVLRFGLEGSDAEAGTVALLDGAALVGGVRKALLASACSVERPGQRFYPRMTLRDADAFVARCELGQTEIGSFVVTVTTPLETEEQLGTSATVPFGRQSTTSLLRALHHLECALTAGEPKRVLEPQGDEPIVSSNLCDALVEMAPKSEKLDLRVSASWSPIMAIAPNTPSTAYFERGSYSVIEDLGRQLRPTRGPNAAQFVGVVSQLSGDPGSDGRLQGDVQLTVQVEEELVAVRVTLTADDYAKAGRAHLEQRYVMVRGVLHRGARIHTLASPSELIVVDDG
jgi:hypothetical protein